MFTADITVPSDGMVCVAMSPAVTRVRNMAVAVRAIMVAVESFRIVSCSCCIECDVLRINKRCC